MQNILISTPLKGGLSSEYVAALIRIMAWKSPDYKFDWSITKGTSTAMARCEQAKVALDGNFDKWVQWDKDLGTKDPRLMLSAFARLVSHDVDVVAAPYVGHNINSLFHGAHAGGDLNSTGLMEMAQVPIGFSCMKVSVLRRLKEIHPHFQYVMKQTDDKVATPAMFEFFPNGIVGPTTGQGKIERLRAIVGEKPTVASIELMEAIAAVIYDNRYDLNYMLGEDYYFCLLARTAGIKLHIDNNLVMPHLSEVRLPVPNKDLLDELLKEWRMGAGVKPEEVNEFTQKLRAYFPDNIP